MVWDVDRGSSPSRSHVKEIMVIPIDVVSNWRNFGGCIDNSTPLLYLVYFFIEDRHLLDSPKVASNLMIRKSSNKSVIFSISGTDHAPVELDKREIQT